MRIVFFILMMLTVKSSLSQVLKVVDTSLQSIPYATIQVPKKNITLFADVNGACSLEEMALTGTDTLIISAIGYTTRKLAMNAGTREVILQRQIRILSEVVIYKGKWKMDNWGSQTKQRFTRNAARCGWVLSGPGDQIGRVVANKKSVKNARLLKVTFYTQHARGNVTPVRLRVYEVDEKGLPGHDVLVRTMIGYTNKNEGWLEFDVSEEQITMQNRLFFAAEYFDPSKHHWKTYQVEHRDRNGHRELKTINQYGGHFALNAEEGEGETWRQHNGQWLRWNTLPAQCHNLVVKVLVKYPDLKVR